MEAASGRGDTGLDLVLGRTDLLEAELAGRIKAAQADDPLTPLAVLLGGTLQRPYLQRRLADLTGGIVNVRFLMPSELAMALGERGMIREGARPVPPLADRILLRQIASEHDGYFAPVRETPGLADALHRLVRELRGAGYDGPAFARAVKGACDAKAKEGALNELFEEFLSRREGFYGPDDCLLAADADDPPWRGLFVFGLWQAPAALRELLAALSQSIPVTVFLPATGTDADSAHGELRAWLESAGAESIELDPPQGNGSALAAAQAGLFAEPTEPAEPAGDLKLLSAPDPSREVREVVRACLGWAREGIRFHEIAVAYRHPDPYRSLLESAFREAGVPVYLHEGSPMAERPLGRRVLALLDLFDSELERRRVMDFVTDGRLPEATRDRYDKPVATRWDRASREAGVVKGLDQWRRRLATRKQELEESEEEWQRERALEVGSLSRFIDDLAEALDDHPQTAPWSQHLEALGRLLDTYVEDPKPIMDALDGLGRFDALGTTVGHEQFIATVKSAIESLRSDEVLGQRPGAFARRGVNVLDVNSLRHLRFRAIAVVGLAERSFPTAPRPDPILLDDERKQLNANGPAPIPLRVRGADTEPLQFSLAVAAAGERLLASFPRKSAGESRPQLPSSFFRALAESVVGHRVEAERIDELPPELYERAAGTRIGAGSPELALSESEYDRTLIQSDHDLGRALLVASHPEIEAAFEARRSRFSRKLTPFDGALSDASLEHLPKLLDPDRGLSVSRIHTYAGCPQRFFLGAVLGAKPIEEPEETISISPMDRGSLIHRILERFLKEDPPKGQKKLYGKGEEKRLLRIAAEEFKAVEDRGQTGYALTWRYDRGEIEEDLRRWLAEERKDPAFAAHPEGSYEVGFGEWHYGDPDNDLSLDRPLEIGIGAVRLNLSGMIDRLSWDSERSRYRVIDYKTGSTWDKPKDGAIKGGKAVQLPLYLYAGAELLEIDPERGSAELHYSTRRGRFQRARFDGEDLERREDDLEQVLGTMLDGMRAGDFQLAPAKERDCQFCDFNGLCPAGRHRLIREKSGDRRAKPLAKIREIE